MHSCKAEALPYKGEIIRFFNLNNRFFSANKLGKEAKNIFKILLKEEPLTKDFIAIKFARNGGRKEIGASAPPQSTLLMGKSAQ